MPKRQDEKAIHLQKIFETHPMEALDVQTITKLMGKDKDGKSINRTTLLRTLEKLIASGFPVTKTLQRNEEKNTQNAIYAYTPSDRKTALPISKSDFYSFLILLYLCIGKSEYSIQNLSRVFCEPAEQIGEEYQEDIHDENTWKWLLPLEESALRKYLSALEEANLITRRKADHSKQDMYRFSISNLNGHEIPASYEEIFDLLLDLSDHYIIPGHFYNSQVKSLTKKLQFLLGEDDELSDDEDVFLNYGRTYLSNDEIDRQLGLLFSAAFSIRVVKVTYRTNSQRTQTIFFKTGLLIHSYEKNGLYIMGKETSEDGTKDHRKDTFIRLDSIKEIMETAAVNEHFQSEEYLEKLGQLFGPSNNRGNGAATCKIIFSKTGKVWERIQTLKEQRPYGSFPEENECPELYDKDSIPEQFRDGFRYMDQIIGISDFENYLRKIGRACYVVEPQSIRNDFYNSAKRALKRYEVEV